MSTVVIFTVVGILALSGYYLSLLKEELLQKPVRPKGPLMPPWFDRLELVMAAQGLDARVVVDVTPMKARILVRGAPRTSSLEDALGRVDAAVSFAVERLRAHGPIALEDGVLVTTLARDRVDAWLDGGGLEAYAADCAVVAHAIVRLRKPFELPPPATATPLPATSTSADDDARPARELEHDSEGAPSGAPIAVPFESGD